MLINREIILSDDYSFFLFGARGTGKSTLISKTFANDRALTINLLSPVEELRFLKNPNELRQIVLAAPSNIQYIVIDEIQKVPKLLDVIHLLIETDKSDKFFIMTGSSAKQLKAAGINLLAGRAFVYNLFPLSFNELGATFNLQEVFKFGLQPKIFSLKSDSNKVRFLKAYTLTYLKEEIWSNRLVKNLDHFRRFLEVAAQSSGKIVNYTNISRDVNVDDKTVKNYFTLLEDTLLGFFLEPYHHSFRKRLRESPRFYLFDIGIVRALSSTLDVNPAPGTSYYGDLFEQFIIIECFKMKHYYQSEYQLSYLRTAADVEIDLIISRAGKTTLLIEIKSKDDVTENDLSSILRLSEDFGECEVICLSQDPRRKKIGKATVYPWQDGLKTIFNIEH